MQTGFQTVSHTDTQVGLPARCKGECKDETPGRKQDRYHLEIRESINKLGRRKPRMTFLYITDYDKIWD